MGPDLQIVQNTSHHLRVSSPQMFFWSGTYVTLAFEVIACLTVYKLLPLRNSSTRTILVVSSFGLVLVLLFALGWNNTLDIDWDKGTASATNTFLTGFQTTKTLATADINRAYIDYDRMGPRIALQLNQGGAILPLGTISMYKPSQYAVMEAINSGLHGRTPDSPSGGDSGSPGFHMDSSVDKAIQHERDFEQKLKNQQQQEKH